MNYREAISQVMAYEADAIEEYGFTSEAEVVEYLRENLTIDTLDENESAEAYRIVLRGEQTSTVTTSYGNWVNHGDSASLSVQGTIEEAFGAWGPEGYDMEAIEEEYRDAIRDALPEGVSLAGENFYGPAEYDAAGDGPSLAERIKEIDLWTIIEKHEK